MNDLITNDLITNDLITNDLITNDLITSDLITKDLITKDLSITTFITNGIIQEILFTNCWLRRCYYATVL